jgi:hypothetical protein
MGASSAILQAGAAVAAATGMSSPALLHSGLDIHANETCFRFCCGRWVFLPRCCRKGNSECSNFSSSNQRKSKDPEMRNIPLTYLGRRCFSSISSKSASDCFTNSCSHRNSSSSCNCRKYHCLRLDYHPRLLPCHTAQKECPEALT